MKKVMILAVLGAVAPQVIAVQETPTVAPETATVDRSAATQKSATMRQVKDTRVSEINRPVTIQKTSEKKDATDYAGKDTRTLWQRVTDWWASVTTPASTDRLNSVKEKREGSAVATLVTPPAASHDGAYDYVPASDKY